MSFRTGEFAIGLIVGIGATCALLLGGNALLDLGLTKAEDGPADWISAVAGFGAMITSLVGVFFLRANLKATNDGVLAALDANHIQSEGSRAWLTVEIASEQDAENHIVRVKNAGAKPALEVAITSMLIRPGELTSETLQETAIMLAEEEPDNPYFRVLMLPGGQENDFYALVQEPTRIGPQRAFWDVLVVVSYRSLANAERKITAQVFSPFDGLAAMMGLPAYGRTELGFVS